MYTSPLDSPKQPSSSAVCTSAFMRAICSGVGRELEKPISARRTAPCARSGATLVAGGAFSSTERYSCMVFHGSSSLTGMVPMSRVPR